MHVDMCNEIQTWRIVEFERKKTSYSRTHGRDRGIERKSERGLKRGRETIKKRKK